MRFQRLSLLTRTALALAVVGLVPLGIASLRLIDLNRDALWEQVLHTHSVAASATAGRIGELLASRRALAEALAAAPEIRADPRSPEAGRRFTDLLEAREDLLAVVLVNSEGEEVLRAQRREAAEEVTRALNRAEEGVTAFREGSDTWLVIDASLAAGAGTARLVWRGESLEEILDPFAIGEQASIVLAHRDGRVLAGSTASLEDFPPPLVEAARSTQVAGAGPFRSAGGEQVLAAYDSVPGTPWFVISRQPAAIANQVSLGMRRDATFAVVLALLLTGGLSAAAYTSLVRPVRDLVRTQRRLAGLADEPARGNEIEALKSSFAALERRVRDQENLEKIFLGRYQVLETMGEGAMGMVFRGWDPKLQRPIALKTVRLDDKIAHGERRELAGRLLHEAVTAARFSHPNIVSIYDVEDTADAAFIAMELVEGTNLERYLWGRGTLAPGEVARLGAQIAHGLAAAHQHEVIHHDVKPANVLLGPNGTIKVTDFGISQAISSLVSREGSLFGTPGYLPPETLQGEGYDERGDLFALGVILYQCLTGVRPFEGKNLKEVILRTVTAEVDPPHRLDPEIPIELSGLVMGLLTKEPEERLGDAEEVAQRLEKMAEHYGGTWPLPQPPAATDSREASNSPHTRILPTYNVEGRPARQMEPAPDPGGETS